MNGLAIKINYFFVLCVVSPSLSQLSSVIMSSQQNKWVCGGSYVDTVYFLQKSANKN